MSNPIIIAGAAAIGVYVMSDTDENGDLPQTVPVVTNGPATAPTPYASPPFAKPSIPDAAKQVVGIAKGFFGGGKKPTGGMDVLSGSLSKQELANLSREKLAELEKKAAAEYKKLSSTAKKAGAEYLNKELKLQPPLDGTETWSDVSKIVGGAAGAAAAGAACAPVGLTAVCAPLGAMLGAYLGPKVGKWLSDTWDDVEDWAGKVYGDVKGGLKKVIPFW